MIRRAALLLALAALAAPTAAFACNVSPSPAIRAEQYKDDPENRRVKGRFTVTETLIDVHGRGIIRGRIETARGTGWDVWVDYNEFMTDCVYFFAPTIDATGAFWIARRAVDAEARPGGEGIGQRAGDRTEIGELEAGVVTLQCGEADGANGRAPGAVEPVGKRSERGLPRAEFVQAHPGLRRDRHGARSGLHLRPARCPAIGHQAAAGG